MKGTSSSFSSCSPESAIEAKIGAIACSPSRSARAPPPIPLRSAHRLPTISLCWVMPPQMKVRIMLCHGAITLVYLDGVLYRNFATASCAAVKAGKNVIMLSAFGVVYDEHSADFGSQITLIGANTAWLRGRSGHTNI